jgi:hypothetical protein
MACHTPRTEKRTLRFTCRFPLLACPRKTTTRGIARAVLGIAGNQVVARYRGPPIPCPVCDQLTGSLETFIGSLELPGAKVSTA